MSPDAELRTPTARPLPELDAEQEVDVGRYWSALAVRWWLPLAGLVLGVAVGYLLALGASPVYKAHALIYLGQPFSPSGNAPVQSLATNPSTVGEIVRSESALREAAAKSGIPLGKLRGRVSTQAVSGVSARRTPGQTPLVRISVTGEARRRVAIAANTLADRVVEHEDVSGYVDVKIATLREEVASHERELAAIEARLAAANAAVEDKSLSAADKLVALTAAGLAEQRRGAVEEDRLAAKQLLSLAENVERADVVERAAARKSTARSPRNSALVGALIGLILGIVAALAWEPVAARAARRPAL